MQDNELIASFEPNGKGWVLVLAFDDLEEALIEQERIQALHRQDRDEHGEALPQVETLFLGQAQYGERSMMNGGIRTGLLVASEAGLREVEEARRAWAQQRMQRAYTVLVKRGMSESWNPTEDQQDMADRWREEVLTENPAGSGGHTQRIKVSIAREGFRQYAMDKDRPDLAFEGSNGGKAFSAMLQAMFPGVVAVRRSEAGHPYIHGLLRKEGANRRYFRLP